MTHRVASDGTPVSLLGYGAMRLPTLDGGHANGWECDASEAGIGRELLARQVRLMLDSGATYFDTSPAYCRKDGAIVGMEPGRDDPAVRIAGKARKVYTELLSADTAGLQGKNGIGALRKVT